MLVRVFAEEEHFTKFHNLALDVLMPRLSANAWKVLTFIIRRTRGWGKPSESLSYGDIKAGTGIRTDATVAAALGELMDAAPYGAPMVLRKSAAERGASRREATKYALNRNFALNMNEQFALRKPKGERAGGTVVSDARPAAGTSISEASRASNSEERGAAPCTDRAQPSTEERYEQTPSESEYGTPASLPILDQAPFVEGDADSRFQSAHYFAVCRACQRGPEGITWKMRVKLAAAAVNIRAQGFSPDDIGRAAALWPHAMAPYPDQLQNDIGPLLNQRAIVVPGARRGVSGLAAAEAEVARRWAARAAVSAEKEVSRG